MRAALDTFTKKVAERLAGPMEVVMTVYDTALPYLIKGFHWGFIPFVILLGMRSAEPRPKLLDLLTPM